MNSFTEAESNHIVNVTEPVGYVVNPGPVETKTPIYSLEVDKWRNDCYMVLTKWVDGKGIWLRYRKDLVVLNR